MYNVFNRWFILIYILEPEKCPATHPYAYLDGKYCCQYGIENIAAADGETCDGGQISLSSSCCKDDAFTKCPSGGCTNSSKYYFEV